MLKFKGNRFDRKQMGEEDLHLKSVTKYLKNLLAFVVQFSGNCIEKSKADQA